MTLRARALVAVAALVVAVAACGGPVPSSMRPPTSSTASPPPTASVAPPDGPSPSGVVDVLIVVDPGLLDVLPAQVSGVDLTPDPATAATLTNDRTLARSVAAIALAAAFGPLPTATDDPGDYAVVTVVRLLPDVFDEGFFREWRDTFDGAVCLQAGGVIGHAEAEIGGHATWIGTCEGGVHTYHVVLRGGELIVSIQGAGERRYGEQVVAGLTE